MILWPRLQCRTSILKWSICSAWSNSTSDFRILGCGAWLRTDARLKVLAALSNLFLALHKPQCRRWFGQWCAQYQGEALPQMGHIQLTNQWNRADPNLIGDQNDYQRWIIARHLHKTSLLIASSAVSYTFCLLGWLHIDIYRVCL